MMFQPTALNQQVIKNKIVRSATRDYLFHWDGTVSDEYVSIYEELAANEVGLILCGYLRVDDKYAAENEPQGSADGEHYLPGLKRIAAACHKHGSLVYGQLSFTGEYEWEPIPEAKKEYLTQKYVNASRTLQKAGFDGVQIHMAHGNYLSKVLTDLDSGTKESRIALPANIISAIKAECGDGFTVISKMNADYDDDELLLYYVEALYRCGMDAVELSGMSWSRHRAEETLYYLPSALKIKEQIGIPVILVGGMYSAETMNTALQAGVDMVSLCRPLIREPDFLKKIQQDEGYISKCKRCNQCLAEQKSLCRRCVFTEESPFLKQKFGG